MRKAILGACAILVVLLAGLFLLSADEKVEAAIIKVGGMECGNCASKVESALTGIEGVKSVKVSLEDKIVRVNYVTSLTDVSSLEKAIAQLGYEAGNTKAAVAHDDKAVHEESCEDDGSADCCGEKFVQPST